MGGKGRPAKAALLLVNRRSAGELPHCGWKVPRNQMEELAQHLDQRYRELLAGGATEDRAYREVTSELDNLHRLKTGVQSRLRLPAEHVVLGVDFSPISGGISATRIEHCDRIYCSSYLSY